MTTPAASKTRHVSRKASLFNESVIREMTREALKHGAVNLSQGFPDFAAPEDIKRVAMQAIADDINQYAITWGSKSLRSALRGAMSCAPMGRPWGPVKSGSVIAGTSIVVQIAQNDALPVESSPTGASPAAAGVSNTS